MSRKKLLQSKRKGSVIVLLMLAIVILLATGVGLLGLGLRSRVFATRTASDITARCAVDAGLTKALFEMNEKLKVKPWDDSDLPQATNEVLPNCDATFSYTVTGDSDSGYIVESIGKSNQAERRVHCALRLQGLFEHGILVQENIVLGNNILVDSYNSADPNDTDTEVQIATASTDESSITLGSNTTIDGEVLVGVNAYFPMVTPPQLTNMGTGINIPHSTTLTIGPADSGEYTGINANQQGILEINGGDVVLHVTGDIYIDNSSKINIKSNSSLKLYVDGDITCRNQSEISNETSEPINFQLYSTGEDEQTFDIKNGVETFGVIYAPNANVTLMNTGDVYGAIVAKNFEMKNNGIFYYDGALSDASGDDVGVRFVIKWWSEQ